MPLVCNNECFYLAGLICPILLARFVICCIFHIRLVLVCLMDSIPSSPWNSILSESIEFEINQPPRIWRLHPVKILALSLLTCSVHARDLQMKFPQIWNFSFQTKSQSSNSFSFREERFWACAGHMLPSLFCATTMTTVYREVAVTHDGPSLQHFQPSHHDFSRMEAAAEAAACISGSWERAAVKVQAVYWWSVKRTTQKRQTGTRKTGKNKPRGLQSRQWCERSWAGYVLIGPLCKQQRFFRSVE